MIIKEIKLLTQIRAVEFIAKTTFKRNLINVSPVILVHPKIYEQDFPQTTRRVSSDGDVDWRETGIYRLEAHFRLEASSTRIN